MTWKFKESTRNLQKDSEKLEDIFRRTKVREIYNFVAFFGFLIGMISLTSFIDLADLSRPLLYLIFLSPFLLMIISLLMREEVPDRLLLSMTLYKIAEDLKNGLVKEEYTRSLHYDYFYKSEKVIRREDGVFEDWAVKESKFWKEVEELAGLLRHYKKHQILDKIDPSQIEELARDIYFRNSGILESLYKITKKYKEREHFPTFLEKIKRFFRYKVSQFVLYELILFLVFYAAYKWIVQDFQTLLITSAPITAAIIYVVFGKK